MAQQHSEETTTTPAERLTDHWLLKLESVDSRGLDALAEELAAEHNFVVVRKVANLDGYYQLEAKEAAVPEGSSRAKRDLLVGSWADRLKSHPAVSHFEREKILVRTKRDPDL